MRNSELRFSESFCYYLSKIWHLGILKPGVICYLNFYIFLSFFIFSLYSHGFFKVNHWLVALLKGLDVRRNNSSVFSSSFDLIKHFLGKLVWLCNLTSHRRNRQVIIFLFLLPLFCLVGFLILVFFIYSFRFSFCFSHRLWFFLGLFAYCFLRNLKVCQLFFCWHWISNNLSNF